MKLKATLLIPIIAVKRERDPVLKTQLMLVLISLQTKSLSDSSQHHHTVKMLNNMGYNTELCSTP